MDATVYTDPLGTVAAEVTHPDGRPSYSDGTAQWVRGRAVQALAGHLAVSPVLMRRRVTLVLAEPGRTVYGVTH